jgi:hypothetical protein
MAGVAAPRGDPGASDAGVVVDTGAVTAVGVGSDRGKAVVAVTFGGVVLAVTPAVGVDRCGGGDAARGSTGLATGNATAAGVLDAERGNADVEDVADVDAGSERGDGDTVRCTLPCVVRAHDHTTSSIAHRAVQPNKPALASGSVRAR